MEGRQRLAFFYCEKDGEKDQVDRILRSLIAQLAWSGDGVSLADSIMKLHETTKQYRTIGTTITIDSPSTVQLVTGQATIVLIDALDQYDNPQQLLLNLSQLSAGSDGSLKFVFSSRELRSFKVTGVFPIREKA